MLSVIVGGYGSHECERENLGQFYKQEGRGLCVDAGWKVLRQYFMQKTIRNSSIVLLCGGYEESSESLKPLVL